MTEPDAPKSNHAMQRLQLAVQARQFEIELFWRRALFFWGFIGAAFVALAAAYGDHPQLAVAITCFGLICSVCWSLANRGSKYWHEAWEQKVHREEKLVIGELFAVIEPTEEKGCWLEARRYSVSRLAIALSDFVAVLWLGMLAYQLAFSVEWSLAVAGYRQFAVLAVLALTATFLVAILVCTRSKLKQ